MLKKASIKIFLLYKIIQKEKTVPSHTGVYPVLFNQFLEESFEDQMH